MADGIYPHEKMEVYAMGFRNQSGVAFGPKGTKWENALAVSDNGANDVGNRRVANGAEKLWIVTEKGQDGGFPDKEGMNFVSNKRFSLLPYLGNPVDRPYPQLYIGDKPFIKAPGPYHFQRHVDGYRGVPLIVANPNPNGYINPVLEWDTNNPIDGIAWSASNFGANNNLFGAVYGILRRPRGPCRARRRREPVEVFARARARRGASSDARRHPSNHPSSKSDGGARGRHALAIVIREA